MGQGFPPRVHPLNQKEVPPTPPRADLITELSLQVHLRIRPRSPGQPVPSLCKDRCEGSRGFC